MAGGFVSILVKTLVFTFLVLQVIAMLGYSDPQISSFKIFESRNDMPEAISMPDYGMRLFFCMTDKQSIPTLMDKRFGRF